MFFRGIINTAIYDFIEWRKNIRIVYSFLIAFVFCFLVTDGFLTYASDSGAVQFLEAFIFSFGDGNYLLLITLLFLLLFADMPFLSSATPFLLVREGRRRWLAGQFLYIFISSCIFMIFMLISTVCLSAGNAFVGNKWSVVTAELSYANKKTEMNLPVSTKVLEMSRPYNVAICIFILIFLYVFMLMSIKMFFTIRKGALAGTAAVITVSTYGLIMNPANIALFFNLGDESLYKARVFVGWASPLNHAIYGMHNFGYDKLPRIWHSILIFVAITTVFICLSYRSLRKYNFSFEGTEKR